MFTRSLPTERIRRQVVLFEEGAHAGFTRYLPDEKDWELAVSSWFGQYTSNVSHQMIQDQSSIEKLTLGMTCSPDAAVPICKFEVEIDGQIIQADLNTNERLGEDHS